MYEYKAPQRDTFFVYQELFDFSSHYRSLTRYEELTQDLWSSIVSEGARFAENVVAPLNQSGDEEGCSWKDGVVTTPGGFKEAYRQYRQAGWPSLDFEPGEGGQGLPESLKMVLAEYLGTANYAWTSLIGFGWAACKSLRAYASKELCDTYIPKYCTGEWLGTMCLTEPHCGTDLGLMRTRAVPQGDGSYSITGTKIFITSGDHDLTENIVHMVLARIEGAPAGTAGISVFLVPKFLDDNGQPGRRNGVHCGSIEHKMGIKGSATCVMNFEEAQGYLVGEPNRGLRAMFLMMNAARIGTGMQGLGHAEMGLQKSAAYAQERLQMRSLSGPKNPNGPADAIIVHPDVRRMLLTQKAIAEGGRMLVAYCARLTDIYNAHDDPEERKRADQQLSFLTPVVKAFLTELGIESASLAVQCFGGHGYIREWGVEQNLRDARIATLYEGTTGVQSLDLLGRKVLASQGAVAAPLFAEIAAFCEANVGDERVQQLAALLPRLQNLTLEVGAKAQSSPDEVGAASVDYLMFVGYVLFAYFWARAGLLARKKIADGAAEDAFYASKVHTAEFYFAKLLPRVEALEKSILAGADSLMAMPEEQFLAHI